MTVVTSGTISFTLGIVLKFFLASRSICRIQAGDKAGSLIRNKMASVGFLPHRSWPESFMTKLQLDIWKQLPYSISKPNPRAVCQAIRVMLGKLF